MKSVEILVCSYKCNSSHLNQGEVSCYGSRVTEVQMTVTNDSLEALGSNPFSYASHQYYLWSINKYQK
jgi:hypothetical protein